MARKRAKKSTFTYVVVTFLVIFLFVGVIFAYYSMLYNETKNDIIKNCQISAMRSAQNIDEYLSIGTDSLKIVSYTLDNMIRAGKSNKEMLDYITNQSPAVESLLEGECNGIYGYVRDEYLDSIGWVPEEGYVPTERPWYIGAKATIGRVAVIDPYLDTYTRTITITLSKTLCDTKSVVAMDFNLGKLQKTVEKLTQVGESDLEIVLDRKYQVIAHSDLGQIGKNYFSEEDTFGKAVVDSMRASEESFFSFEYKGREYIGYSETVANDWICLSIFDATAEFAPLRKIWVFTRAAIVGVVLILLIIMIRSGMKARLAERMNETAEEAVAVSEAKTSFLSNMSHEIRTPINAILGMNEMILRECEDQNILVYSNNIKTASNTLLGLINDILDFSKIEAGKIEIINDDYDLSSVINDLVNMIQSRADSKGLLLKLDFDKNMPKALYGDEVRIKQVIANILTNAVKYTEKGSVTFKIAHERIEGDPNHIYLKVAVTDTGIGIKHEDLEKLFIKFQRIEEKRNRNIEGAGLGMTITKNLLEMMGSRLEVESVYGEGSTFSFRLRQKVMAWDEIGDYEKAYKETIIGQKKYKEKFIAPNASVLVVDDVQMNLEVFKSLLKKTKVQIDTATSGNEGLALTQQKKYDIVFLDHMMPEKDGIETLHELRHDEENKNLYTPMICLTANAISGAREVYLREGFDDYLTKPIDADALEKMISIYLPNDKIQKLEEAEGNEQAGGDAVAELPKWLYSLPDVNVEKGVSHCGSEEAYLETLTIYGKNAPGSVSEIESLWAAQDLENTTVKVHAIKSLSRAIGAEDIGALAEKLELAGKAGDRETIAAELSGLLERIRKVCDGLKPLCEEEELQVDESELPELAEDELREAYINLKDVAETMDAKTASYVFSFLLGYRLPNGERERVEKMKKAVDGFDWDKVIELVEEYK